MNDKDYSELAIKVEGIDGRCISNASKINEHDDEIKELREDTKTLIRLTSNVEIIAISVADVNKKVDVIGAKQDKLNDKVTVLENRPANETRERWENILDKASWIIVGGLIVGVLAVLFPNIPW